MSLLYENTKPVFIVLLLMSLSSGCAYLPTTTPLSTFKHSAQTTRLTMDWSGTYYGVLPCDDCGGLRTTLTLYRNDTYVETVSSELRPETEYSNEGRFIWNWLGDEITLSNGREYKVLRDMLVRLDESGKVIEGKNADDYILWKKGE